MRLSQPRDGFVNGGNDGSERCWQPAGVMGGHSGKRRGGALFDDEVARRSAKSVSKEQKIYQMHSIYLWRVFNNTTAHTRLTLCHTANFHRIQAQCTDSIAEG
jgi:hypothetical protein